ncbi:SH3 domain-containing protein, partial [Pseudomonas aeruginosa]
WPVFDMKKYLVQYITRSTLLRWEDFLVAVEASEKIKAGIAGADSASLVEYTRQLILSAESDGMTSLLGGSTRAIVLGYLDGTRSAQDIRSEDRPAALIGSMVSELQERGVDLGTPATGPASTSGGTVWAALSTPMLLTLLLVLFQSLAALNDAREAVCDINNRLPLSNTFAEARKFVRTRLCGAPAALVRIVKANDVNVRLAPSMRAEVIALLPKGAAVAIVNVDNRDWLEVSFQRDGYVVEGWVSRKYLGTVF